MLIKHLDFLQYYIKQKSYEYFNFISYPNFFSFSNNRKISFTSVISLVDLVGLNVFVLG